MCWWYGRGAKPTGRREQKGKETLTELAALELVLERKPNQPIPSATVVKSRLVWINPEDPSDIRPALPPRLPEATWKKIREYFQNPPDWGKLSEEEKYQEKPLLTEEEKLILQAQVAQARTGAVAYVCTDCGVEITETKVGGKVWTVNDIIRSCEKNGWPPLCIECGKKRKEKEGA